MARRKTWRCLICSMCAVWSPMARSQLRRRRWQAEDANFGGGRLKPQRWRRRQLPQQRGRRGQRQRRSKARLSARVRGRRRRRRRHQRQEAQAREAQARVAEESSVLTRRECCDPLGAHRQAPRLPLPLWVGPLHGDRPAAWRIGALSLRTLQTRLRILRT